MEINQLSKLDTVTDGDLAVVFSQTNGDARAAAMSVLLKYLQSKISSAGNLVTQYASPNATAFAVQIAPPSDGTSMFLILTPTAGFAAGTINLPAVAVDGQRVEVTCTQAITALTVGAPLANPVPVINGAPTTLAANGFFRMRYDGVNKSWYRVG